MRQLAAESGLDNDTKDALIGDVAAFIAAVGTGLYFVLFNKFIGEAGNTTISLYTSLAGLTILILVGPFAVLQLVLIDWQIPSAGITVAIVLATASGFIINYLMNVGISLTSPLFIAIGCMLSVPGTALADLVFRGATIGALQLLGIVVVIAGFVLLNIDVATVKAKIKQWKGREDIGDSHVVRLAVQQADAEADAEGEADTSSTSLLE